MNPPAPTLVPIPPELTPPSPPPKRSASTVRKPLPQPPLPPGPVAATPLTAAPKVTADTPPVGVVLDVNLLPFESRPIEVVEGYGRRLALVALAAVGVVAVGYGILSFLIVQRTQHVLQIRQKAQTLVAKVDAFRPQLQSMELASRKLRAVEQVLRNRIDWLSLLDKLQALTLVSVSYTTASLSSQGDLSLGVEASSIGDLARQLKVFEQSSNVFNQVSLGSITVNEDTDQSLTHVGSTFQLHLSAGWAQADMSPAPGR